MAGPTRHSTPFRRPMATAPPAVAVIVRGFNPRYKANAGGKSVGAVPACQKAPGARGPPKWGHGNPFDSGAFHDDQASQIHSRRQI